MGKQQLRRHTMMLAWRRDDGHRKYRKADVTARMPLRARVRCCLKTACALIAFASAMPAAAQQLTCQPPLQPMLRIELYFGRSIAGDRPVSDREWARFVAQELTPRFPDLTVLDARGAWRKGQHEMRGHTKLVIIVVPEGAAARGHIAEVTEAYKHRFRQTSVGVVTQSVCASF